MRRKNSSTYNKLVLSITIALFLNIFIPLSLSSTEHQQLYIYATDEVYENEYFPISVYTLNENSSSVFLTNVEIEFNGEKYYIDNTTVEVLIPAPMVDEDTVFYINASKTGFISYSKPVLVKNKIEPDAEEPELIVKPSSDPVDSSNLFSVTVTFIGVDDKEYPVEGVKVAIQSYGEPKFTDEFGKARLTAPSDDWDSDIFTVIANKTGYKDGRVSVGLNKKPGLFESIIQNPYFPILLAIVFLVIIVIFVHFRQERSIYNRAKEISNEKVLKKYSSKIEEIPVSSGNSQDNHGMKTPWETPVRVRSDQDAKVEEIRLIRSRKEKEVVPVKEDETDKMIMRKKIQRRDYDWFEGTDEIRYEIDKLTGEIDEEGVDKWFEGVENLKEKLDEKMKKKNKKKKNGE